MNFLQPESRCIMMRHALCLPACTILLAFLIINPHAAMSKTTDDPERRSPVPHDAELEEIATGLRFTEGPYWRAAGYLVFSDIPASIVYRWSPEDGLSVYREPSGRSNGITADAEGRLILAQHDGRVSRNEPDGSETILADTYKGRRLNSPNDLVVRSDGSIYFTDPPYGVQAEERELDFSGVYRIHPDGNLELLTRDYDYPNGLCFSPDESVLYVNDSDDTKIFVYDADENGNLSSPRLFAEPADPEAAGTTDGMKVDVEGNLYTTGPGGVWIYTPGGELLDRIHVPVAPTNLAFGGEDNMMLYITARQNVYRIQLAIPGVK